MTMLGATAKRERTIRERESRLSLGEVKIGCELALLFMLWHHPRPSHLRPKGTPSWFEVCTKEMVKYPEDGYRYLWWWALRHLGEPKKDQTIEQELDGARSYLEWKFEQVNGRPIGENETNL